MTTEPSSEKTATELGWIRCYVEGCEGKVTENLRLHMRNGETQEKLACAKHASILRMMAL